MNDLLNVASAGLGDPAWQARRRALLANSETRHFCLKKRSANMEAARAA